MSHWRLLPLGAMNNHIRENEEKSWGWCGEPVVVKLGTTQRGLKGSHGTFVLAVHSGAVVPVRGCCCAPSHEGSDCAGLRVPWLALLALPVLWQGELPGLLRRACSLHPHFPY